MQYSHSRISAFENCPYQYKLRYIDKIKSEKEGIEAFMGSRVHETLERLYEDVKQCKENHVEHLLKYYNSQWEKKWHENVEIVKKRYTQKNYRDMGAMAIIEYYERFHPFDDGKILGLEERVQVPLGDDVDYSFVGYVDRLMMMPDGSYEIHDYKTSGKLPTQLKVDEDKQLALYQLAVEDFWSDAKDNVKLVWHYLRFDSEMRTTKTREQLNSIVRGVRSLIETIEATEVFEPKESMLCNWCGYQELCPTRKHGKRVEILTLDDFQQDDGVQLVDKYVDVDNRIKVLKELKENLKKAIVKYSEKEDVAVIVGSGHKVKISSYYQVSVPSRSKAETEYEKLVKVLKEAGVWEEVAALDKWALIRKLRSGEWNGELKASVEKFLIQKEQRKLSVVGLREKE